MTSTNPVPTKPLKTPLARLLTVLDYIARAVAMLVLVPFAIFGFYFGIMAAAGPGEDYTPLIVVWGSVLVISVLVTFSMIGLFAFKPTESKASRIRARLIAAPAYLFLLGIALFYFGAIGYG